MISTPLNCARVAVALSRTSDAPAMTLEAVAMDAVAIDKIARQTRRAVERQQPADTLLAEASNILSRYGAEAVLVADLEGCVLAARFPGARSGFRNLFFIS